MDGGRRPSAAIVASVTFLRVIGCPTRLSEVGISDGISAQRAEDAAIVVRDDQGRLPGPPPMTRDDIVELLRSAL